VIVMIGSLLSLISIFILFLFFLRWGSWLPTAFMQRNRAALRRAGQVDELRQTWVDYDHISPQMRLAALAAEDQQFPEHVGFAWYGMLIAWQGNRMGEPLRGYSTISQQLTKNLFLWPARTYFRKILEAILTLMLEVLWSKRRILESYLNVVQFGEKLFGIEAASRHYFHKPALDLTAAEASLLAVILPNPLQLKIEAPTNWMLERQAEIMQGMDQVAARYPWIGRDCPSPR
jgi:monofunctional biosynthetic peptidoglycan transglycosylase